MEKQKKVELNKEKENERRMEMVKELKNELELKKEHERKVYREHLLNVYVDVTQEQINEFDFTNYKDILDEEEEEMVNIMKAHIIVKHKIESIGLECDGGTIGELKEVK